MPFAHARRGTTFDDWIYVPPLLHALGTHSWAYAMWLLKAGASLEEKVNAEHDLLDAVMAMQSLDVISFIFRECSYRQQAAAYVPNYLREAGGYFICNKFLDMSPIRGMNRHIAGIKVYGGTYNPQELEILEEKRDPLHPGKIKGLRCYHPEVQANDMAAILECYKYLLKTYPELEDAPRMSQSICGLVAHFHVSLLYHAAQVSRYSKGDLLLRTIEAYSSRAHGYPAPNLTTYLWASPLDPYSPESIFEIFREAGLTLGDMYPSITQIYLIWSWISFCVQCLLSLVGPPLGVVIDAQVFYVLGFLSMGVLSFLSLFPFLLNIFFVANLWEFRGPNKWRFWILVGLVTVPFILGNVLGIRLFLAFLFLS